MWSEVKFLMITLNLKPKIFRPELWVFKKMKSDTQLFMETCELVLSKQYIMSVPDFVDQHTEPYG